MEELIMFKFFKNYKRAKKLIAEDDKRIELEKLKKLKVEKIQKEISKLRPTDIAYLQNISEIDIKNPEINLATLYREINRIKLSLHLFIPTSYQEIFTEKITVIFDSVYIRNAEFSSYEKSLTEIEDMFAKLIGKENWPPEKIDLDCFDEACYYSLYNSIVSDIANFKKLLSLINSYS